MQTIVTSDFHLGCEHCREADLLDFMRGLPDGARLVLNGDIITHYRDEMSLEGVQREVLDCIREASFDREVIWVRGNNDKRLKLEDPGRIKFVDEYAIGKRLYIAHGHRFDRLMPTARLVTIPMRLTYDAISRLVGGKTHVAQFAKRLNALYMVLCRHVAKNAVRYAKLHGYEAVACGHTHYSEDLTIDGIRYLNTGCWTEPNTAVVEIDEDGRIEYRSLPSGEPGHDGGVTSQ